MIEDLDGAGEALCWNLREAEVGLWKTDVLGQAVRFFEREVEGDLFVGDLG